MKGGRLLRRLPFVRRTPREPPPPGPAEMAVRADFEGGNVENAEIFSASHVRFSARADASPRPLWFYFCIDNARVPAVRCDLVNADACLGPRLGWRAARPVFSADGRVWQRLARASYVELDAGSGYFTFTVPVVGPHTYVAYCYPYTTEDLAALLGSLPNWQGLEQTELSRSAEGRPVPYLRLGNHDAPAHTVWLLARQHAGETPASFTVEGFLQEIAREDPAAAAMLEDTAFHVVPMVDVDGVYHGRYGKDQTPVDYNRDWREEPELPEIRSLASAIHAAHERQPLDLVLDVHAPHHGDTSCYVFGAAGEESGGPEWQARLLRFLAQESPASVGFRPSDLRADSGPSQSAREYLGRTLGVPVLTLETSYHLAQSGEYLTPQGYREFGAALARAVHRLLHEDAAG